MPKQPFARRLREVFSITLVMMAVAFGSVNAWANGDPGDIDLQNGADLTDAVLAVQIMSGIVPDGTVAVQADVDSDGRIGSAEALLALQMVAGLRYRDTALSGVWIVDIPSGPGKIYLIGDGVGGIVEYSGVIRAGHGATPPGGTYHVDPGGALTMALDLEDGATQDIAAALTSPTGGTVHLPQSGTFHKVTDTSACQGNWVGTFTESLTGVVRPVCFTVDAVGTVTEVAGLNGPASGRMFSEEGKLAAFFKSGETDSFNQVSLSATLSDDMVTGSFAYDGPDSPNGTVSLTRQAGTVYGDVDFYGPWIIDLPGPQGPGKIYFIGDGTGGIVEYSGIIQYGHGATPPGGTYAVATSGAFSMSLDQEDGGTITVSGQLSHKTGGSVTAPLTGSLYKVTDVGTCQGSWNGSLSPYTGNGFTIGFTVDAGGTVTAFSGLNGPVTGRMFSTPAHTAAYFKTGEGGTSPFNQLTFSGSLNGGSLTGSFSYDGPDSPNGTIDLSR